MTKRKCFSISTYLQFEELIKLNKNKRKVLIILIKNYLVKGFGADWVNTFIDLIKKNYPEYNIKFFVDCGNDSGLSITFLNEKIDYLKIRSNSIVLKKINQIARKNKVLLNPNFNIVELSKIKNYNNLKL